MIEQYAPLPTTGFYFDVGGVLIPDKFGYDARAVFAKFAEHYNWLDPDDACKIYARLQPGLDSGDVDLLRFCRAIHLEQQTFEREWLALHPVDSKVLNAVEQLVDRGYPVGLATNFCKRLLDLLLKSNPVLSRLSICCSSDIRRVKPSREFFNHAHQIIGTPNVIFVDDRAVNIAAARDFGWTAIQADDGWLSRFERTYLRVDCPI